MRSPRSIRALLNSLGLTAGLGVSSCASRDGGGIGAAPTGGASTGTSAGNATGDSSGGAATGGASTGASSGWTCQGNCPAGSLGEVDWSTFDGSADICTVEVGLFPSNCGALSCIVPCPDAGADAAPAVDAGTDVDEREQGDATEEQPGVADANGVE